MELLQFRKKRRRIKKGVLAIILAFLFVIAAVLTFILIFGGAEATSRTGKLSGKKTYSAVVIRSEKIAVVKDFDTADYLVRNGQQVRKGDSVMNVYNLGYSRENTEKLLTVREQILDAQLRSDGETRDPELKSLNDGIASARDMLSKAVMNGNTSAVQTISANLKKLLSERSDYLREKSQQNETLRGLYQQEDDLLQAVEAQRVTVAAERDGVVSFYIDDFASTLNADKIGQDLVTAELISKALDKNERFKWTGSSSSSAFRLVNPNEWYCAFLTGTSESLRVAPGKEYSVEVKGYGSFIGTGVSSFVNDKNVVNIIKFSQNLGALIDVRTCEISIAYEAEGMMIEKRAIQFKDGETYIEIVTDNGRANVYVDVLAEDGRNAIIRIRGNGNIPTGTEVRYWIPKRGRK
ncbi:MAG: hypothetical protein IJM20_07490 [Clostridia bacterium]|nr:hypothetical protein [Clostridia bacterium]